MTFVILNPMRYSAGHKLATRRRILEAASAAFRESGVAATGVDDVMRRAGLTHGGFYAHFRDKNELIAEACATGFDMGQENLARIAALPTRRQRVRALAASYLSAHHRDDRAGGCLVAALGAEASRPKGRAQRGYAEALQRHRGRLAAALRLAEDPAENERLTTSLLSMLIGALILARSLLDEAASRQLLAQTRETAIACFG